MDEEKGIVGCRTEQADDQDGARERADREPGVGQAVGGCLCSQDGGKRAEKGKEPEEGAAIDDKEHDRDDEASSDPTSSRP